MMRLNGKKGNRWTISGIITGLLLLPGVSYAAGTYFKLLFIQILFLTRRIVPVIMGIALLFFLWGLARYIMQTDSVEGKKSARDIMIWGIITLFVMSAIWGFVALLQQLTGARGLYLIPPSWPEL